MNKKTAPHLPRTRFVDHLPDLMMPEDYQHSPDKKKVRIRITFTDMGIEIIGDSRHVPVLEELLSKVGAEEIEMMLCG